MKEKKKKGVQQFNYSALSLKKIEERKEMLVRWRRREGFFPKQQL
jgi:hypothetical protein